MVGVHSASEAAIERIVKIWRTIEIVHIYI